MCAAVLYDLAQLHPGLEKLKLILQAVEGRAFVLQKVQVVVKAAEISPSEGLIAVSQVLRLGVRELRLESSKSVFFDGLGVSR